MLIMLMQLLVITIMYMGLTQAGSYLPRGEVLQNTGGSPRSLTPKEVVNYGICIVVVVLIVIVVQV